MSSRIKYSLSAKIALAAITFIFTAISSFAAVNSISGIDVQQGKDLSYNIMLKLDKSAKVIKSSTEKDNLTLTVNSTLPADSIEIIYDNAAELNNIIVQKKNKDNTVILLQGKNIENADIFTKEISTGLIQKVNDNKLNIFFLNKKYSVLSVSAMFFMFFFMLFFRKQNKHINHINETVNKKRNNKTADTLRHKNIPQSRTVPSINYKVTGSFNTSNMSVPKDFVINNYNNEHFGQIRKAG